MSLIKIHVCINVPWESNIDYVFCALSTSGSIMTLGMWNLLCWHLEVSRSQLRNVSPRVVCSAFSSTAGIHTWSISESFCLYHIRRWIIHFPHLFVDDWGERCICHVHIQTYSYAELFRTSCFLPKGSVLWSVSLTNSASVVVTGWQSPFWFQSIQVLNGLDRILTATSLLVLATIT